MAQIDAWKGVVFGKLRSTGFGTGYEWLMILSAFTCSFFGKGVFLLGTGAFGTRLIRKHEHVLSVRERRSVWY